MNEKALHTLEYDKIIGQLSQLASSAPGRERCLALRPSSSISEINRLQDETEAAVARILKKGSISFGSTYDIRASLKRLEIGSSLGIHELLQIAKLLENVALVRAYAKRERDTEADDILSPMFQALEPLKAETDEIRRCIISEEEISDAASPALRQIRRNIRLTAERVRTELTRLVSSSAKDYLQDSLITTRDGRYCIPVKNEFRTQVAGIIHDTSKTGSTVYIEPASVVKLNNEIRELKIREEQEIETILANLSSLLAEKTGFIRVDYDMMSELDFIFARARLALDENATRPLVSDDGVIDIRKARHPLLPKGKAVPIDIRLGEEFDLLVVTGPNTGGKTVSLKTTGLLTLMGLSGLHIPAADRSRLAVFSEVYADIGDEQSIEQSLSTFSSHMTNVVEFLRVADEHSLVLFDELGAGTDPTEGAALAIAILSSLHRKGIRTMATTHYSEIKVYALKTYGVENACCEFNVDTLSPTYRLLIGVPGKSNAFAISSSCGEKEAAWAFVRQFFLPAYQEQLSGSVFPTNLAVYEQMKHDALTTAYQRNPDGSFALDDDGRRIEADRGSVTAAGMRMKLRASTEEEIALVEEIVAATSHVLSTDNSLKDLIVECAAPYFVDQRSVEDVVRQIQSRASIYVNEQR